MIAKLLLRVAVLAGVGLGVPGAVQAQGPPPASQDTTELSFEREVFAYPQYERRNPFAPLLSAEGGGPRFERIVLIGILYAPGSSLALIAEGTRTVVSETEIAVEVTGATYRLRVGDSVGNTTVRAIERHHVEVEVEEFGLIETRIMEMPNRVTGQGGPE